MTVEDAAGRRAPRPAPDGPSNVLEQFSMRGRVVAITGAADGIGFAVAEAMAEAGGDVALWYNSYVAEDLVPERSRRRAKVLKCAF